MFSLPQHWVGSGVSVFTRVSSHTNTTCIVCERPPAPTARHRAGTSRGPSPRLRPAPTCSPGRPRTPGAATPAQHQARRLPAHLDALVAGAGGHAAPVEVEGHIVDEVAVIRGDAARHEHPAAAATRAHTSRGGAGRGRVEGGAGPPLRAQPPGPAERAGSCSARAHSFPPPGNAGLGRDGTGGAGAGVDTRVEQSSRAVESSGDPPRVRSYLAAAPDCDMYPRIATGPENITSSCAKGGLACTLGGIS